MYQALVLVSLPHAHGAEPLQGPNGYPQITLLPPHTLSAKIHPSVHQPPPAPATKQKCGMGDETNTIPHILVILAQSGQPSPVSIGALHGRPNSNSSGGILFGAILQDLVHSRQGRQDVGGGNVVVGDGADGAFHKGDHQHPPGLEGYRECGGREVGLRPAVVDQMISSVNPHHHANHQGGWGQLLEGD